MSEKNFVALHAQLSQLDRGILQCSAEVAESQRILAVSPSEIDDSGALSFCAASCLAFAGLASVSTSKAKSFRNSLEHTNETDVLGDAFDELGWSRLLCDNVRQQNDALRPQNRRAWFLSEIKRCLQVT